MNKQHNVNEPIPRGASLEHALLGKLQEILGEIGWLSELPTRRSAGANGPDATIRLSSASGTRADLLVHVKSQMRPSTFPAWAAVHRTDDPERHAVPVLAMPFVSPRLASLCQQARWSWLDLSGNCWLDVPGSFRVERSGRPPSYRPPRRAANLSTPAAARVIRVLLSPAHAERVWTQRQLQEATCWPESEGRCVSLGLVNKVFRHLRNEGYVTDADGHGVRLHDPMGLLRAWNEAYRFDRHERRSYFTLLKRAQLDEALYRTGLDAGGMAVYAAFSAAERQAPQVRQPKAWVYLAAEFVDTMASHTQAKVVDSGENLVVLIPDDPGVFLSFASFDTARSIDEQSLGCTDSVQTYVDLLHCGGRGEEAAQGILHQRILPAWKKAGLA